MQKEVYCRIRVSSHEESLMFSLHIEVVSGIFPLSKEHLLIITNNRPNSIFWYKCEVSTHFQVKIHMHFFSGIVIQTATKRPHQL